MTRQGGFSLIELSIVVLILGLLLTGLSVPLSVQLENARINEAEDFLSVIEKATLGYAVVNGHLPCPATPASNGASATVAGGCTVQHGFVPGTTLGLTGSRNADGLLLDPWASPIRYSVTDSDADTDGDWDFVTPGEIADVTVAVLAPDLVICNSAAGSTATACSGPATTLVSGTPMIIYSLGSDWASFTSPDQQENVGAALGGGPSGTSYPIAADDVSVYRRKSEQAGNEYDDVMRWMPPSQLYHTLLVAGQLP